MMQEIVVYIILIAAITYFIVSIVKNLRPTVKNIGCDGCTGCSLQGIKKSACK